MTITYTLGENLYVNITNRCTNRCSFCIRNNGSGVGSAENLWLEREPTADEIYADIIRQGPSNFKTIVFCGYGEPLLRLDDIVGVCRRLKEKFPDLPPIKIDTNGQADLIYRRPVARELAGLVDIISISLNAPDAASYQSICQSDFGEDAFDAILRFAADCKKTIPDVYFSVVDVIPPEDIQKCREIAEKTGVKLRIRKKQD